MNKKICHSRRDFIGNTLFAGAAFTFAKFASASQDGNNLDGSYGTPLKTEKIPQPEDDNCFWTGFSPVTDQVAFITATRETANLYISHLGQPESFDLVWSLKSDKCNVTGCAWTPDGKEIAVLSGAINKKSSPPSTRVSICVANAATKAIRETIIKVNTNVVGKIWINNTGDSNGVAWFNDSCVCTPMSDGRVMKFDTYTGDSETIIEPQQGTFVRNVALTHFGELRFVRTTPLGPGNGENAVVCSLRQDGTIYEFLNLTQELGKIFFSRLSQNGEYVFAENGFPPADTLIYKIENKSIIGKIPQRVSCKDDTYGYFPVDVINDKELIIIEISLLSADGDKPVTNTIMKAAKIIL